MWGMPDLYDMEFYQTVDEALFSRIRVQIKTGALQ